MSESDEILKGSATEVLQAGGVVTQTFYKLPGTWAGPSQLAALHQLATKSMQRWAGTGKVRVVWTSEDKEAVKIGVGLDV